MKKIVKISDLLQQKGGPLVMGILNVTTDSFYDGGRYVTESAILRRAEQILQEGGDIIDVGAVSTRPGAEVLYEQTEKERVVQTVRAIRVHWPEAVLSVDTFRASVAQAAVDYGADLINDVSGGTFDAKMLPTMGRLQVPYVLMHTPAMPDKMQQCTDYDDILADMCAYFDRQLQLATQQHIQDIVLDPGFGFGKTLEQNYYLLEHLEAFRHYGLPLMIGLSRKSMIYKIYQTTPLGALAGTLEATKVALRYGNDLILRVHDVADTCALLPQRS